MAMGGWNERVMGQTGFFDVERRLEAISALGDPLETVQDRDDEPRLQHPSAGSARADGACARLSALTGVVCVAS